MPKYQIYGKVTRTSDQGTKVVAEGSITKEAASPEALRAAWLTDMKKVFRDGPHDTVDYYCRVTPVAAPPAPETKAGADGFARPARLPAESDNVALDTILQARAPLRNMAAVAWSNILSMIFGGRRT